MILQKRLEMDFKINIKNKLIQIKNHRKLKKIEQFFNCLENRKYP